MASRGRPAGASARARSRCRPTTRAARSITGTSESGRWTDRPTMRSPAVLLAASLTVLASAGVVAQYQAAGPQEGAVRLTVNPVKQALANGQAVLGATITAASPDVAATLAGA